MACVAAVLVASATSCGRDPPAVTASSSSTAQSPSTATGASADDELAWLRTEERVTWSPLMNFDGSTTEVAVVPARDVVWNGGRVASFVFAGDGLRRATREALRDDSLYVQVTVAPRDGRARCFGGCDVRLTSPELDDVVLKVCPGWGEAGETTRAFFRLPEVPRLRVGPVAHRVSAFQAK
jgi:hypothetical protein